MENAVGGLGVRLQEALNLRELMNTSVTTFTVAPPDSDDELDSGQMNFCQDSQLLDKINLNCVDMNEDEDSTGSPFERLSSKMTDVTSCGKVRKQVLRSGEGPPVPENSTVVVHYNAFIEHFDEPFDSSYLRGKPDRFNLSSDAVIAGLQIALKTMRKKEKAHFMIHPDMAYGKLGCPPRIPQNAEVLFEVELLNYVEDPGLSPDDDDPKQEKTFEDYYKAVQIFNIQGNEEFLRGNTKAAIAKYRQATNILERVRMENDEQEQRYKKLIFRLYTNLAVCYNKDGKPYKVLDVCKRAYAVCDDKKGKLYFNHGKALVTIGDFKPALTYLNKAKRLVPNDEAVNKEIKKLNDLKMKYDEEERSRVARGFGFSQPTVKDQQLRSNQDRITEGFAVTVRNILRELENTRKNCMVLPKGLTNKEERFILDEAKQLGMNIVISDRGGQKTLSINNQ